MKNRDNLEPMYVSVFKKDGYTNLGFRCDKDDIKRCVAMNRKETLHLVVKLLKTEIFGRNRK